MTLLCQCPEWLCVLTAATLVDTVGNAALRTKLDNTGVSLHIATTYMLPADLAITKPLNGLVC